jgi:hypothetical protein
MAVGEDGNGSFATHEITTEEFIPSVPEDWCGAGWGSDCYSLDLTDFLGSNSVKIAFESYNMRGNYLYIDNILLDYKTGIKPEVENNASAFDVFPNPNNGVFTLSNFTQMENAKVEVYGPLGQVVYTENNLDLSSKNTLDVKLKGISKGVYFVKISNEDSSYQSKFVIE